MGYGRVQFGLDRFSDRKAGHLDPLSTPIMSRNTTRGIIMKRIPLTQGKFALVDNGDYGYLKRWKWCAVKDPRTNTYYAMTKVRYFAGDKQHIIMMHRLLLEAKDGDWCDHKNTNGLDNTRGNIRICTPAQNAQNRRISSQNTSGYKGVCWNKARRKWQSKIGVAGKQETVGYFSCLIKAAKAYDARAIELFGEFARPNFPERRNHD